ncbi:conjugal transfer protein TraG N-terminal domain-containing protein [Sphingobium estronivorans]|uniref:conjugal transfer protein TraG N-terminal domain-containing protein n=1 Tax=Sphingobium estronivorans TaxID=1577690 RepID=UPI00123C6DFD|nr:conjugal transfer protein TraG N-terminal domain-containing protein [Sphingobium estronivorans]
MLEVFTVGGGEYLVNCFNAVAAWSGGGGYRSMIRVVMVMGLIYSLFVVAFTLNYKALLNWFLQSTLIYMCLMVPTVDIKVTDRINPSLAPATVAHVPMGLGILASFTTQIGDYLTRTAETVFVSPSELNYSSNGLVYGARLFDATRNFTIRDAEFSANLDQYLKQCVFGDILLYQKSLTDLADAKNLWAAMASDAESRSQEYLERSGGTVTPYIVTCKQAYALLDSQWSSMINANAKIWGLELYPRLSDMLAEAKLRNDVPIVNHAFTGASDGFVETMRQNTAINAFMQARSNMSGSAIDAFAQARADIQARNTYNSIAQQAMTWVPILNVVLTVVFFAMFPVIFPLFLMPQTGVSAFKGYATGFFYLAAWGPLYVILHMICMTRAEVAASGVAKGGMSLGTYAGIGAVNAETATIAGFMLMSVPFLAAGLAKGAMSIAGQSMSMLAPAQNAAEAAALEQTTGNYAFGNVSWANQTSNMRQSGQWSMAPSYQDGSPSFGWRHDNGASVSSFGNGGEVIDMHQAISRLDVEPRANTGFVSELREQASVAERQAKAFEAAASDILTSTHTNRSAFGTSAERSSGWDSSRGQTAGTSIERYDRTSASSSQGFDEKSSTGQSQSVSKGQERSANIIDSVAGNAGLAASGRGDVGNGGRGFGTGNVGIGVSRTGQQEDRLRYGTTDQRSSDSSNSSSTGFRDEHSSGANANETDGTYDKSGVFERATATTSSSQSTEDALSRAQSYQETARKLHELSEQLSRDASYAETHGMQLSANLSQDLADWYRAETARNPGMGAPELWATTMTDQQRDARSAMINAWMQHKRAEIGSEVRGLIDRPDLVDVPHRSIGGYDEVRSTYHPHGVAPLANSPALGDSDAAGRIIDAGKRVIEEERKSALTNRNSAVQGSVDVQSAVNAGNDKGFFRDPDLRK